MIRLKLSSRPLTKLPASSFPEKADIYLCDKCGRDITPQFHPGQSHTWSPMGPERFKCECGQKYVTGATEWDHFGEHERRRRFRDTFGLGILFSAVSSILGLFVYLALHFVFGFQRGALYVWLIIAWLPFSLMQIGFWPGVIASMWRTRIAKPK